MLRTVCIPILHALRSALRELLWQETEVQYRFLGTVGLVGELLTNLRTDNAPKDWVPASKWEQTLKDITASLEDGKF